MKTAPFDIHYLHRNWCFVEEVLIHAQHFAIGPFVAVSRGFEHLLTDSSNNQNFVKIGFLASRWPTNHNPCVKVFSHNWWNKSVLRLWLKRLTSYIVAVLPTFWLSLTPFLLVSWTELQRPWGCVDLEVCTRVWFNPLQTSDLNPLTHSPL